MKVSVAICTWNRAKLLARTLDQFRELIIPNRVTWELIVVDNASTDETSEVIAHAEKTLPIVPVRELNQGHTFARNAAIDAASGEIILWTDDDVLVDPHWIAEYVEACRATPESQFFGGPIESDFECEPPAWLMAVWPEVSGLYAIRDLGDEPFTFTADRVPFGANFAIRTELQRAHKFDTRLGRRGSALGASDETTLLRKLLNDGYQGSWVPGARVQHFIPEARMTVAYLRGNFIHQGKALTIQDLDRGEHLRMVPIVKIIVTALRAEVRCRIYDREEQAEQWLKALRQSSFQWGRLAGFVRPSL